MLATLVPRPFHNPGWIYEEKYDGIRLLAYKEGGRVSLLSRNNIERTQSFPAIAAAIANIRAETLLLDGETVVFDRRHVSRFQLLQERKGELFYAMFDCLWANGDDLRQQPLSKRRAVLHEIVRPAGPLLLAAMLADDGHEAFQIAKRRGLEGLVAKNLASSYVEKRSREWLKVKVHQEQEFVIGGFTAPTGSREDFGALLLGVYDHGKLQYVGKVGTGFDNEALASLHRRFRALIRKNSPFASPVREKGATFLTPKLVAQVAFTEWTKDGKLRHPVYLGLRDDKEARDVVREAAT